MELEFIHFDTCHFEAYQQWFQDRLLVEALGPSIDKEWLDFVLNDKTGIQFAVHSKNELISVVGLAKPTDASPFWVVTDLAVNPAMRRRGIAFAILDTLPEVIGSRAITAYVMKCNTIAQTLFHAAGWLLQPLDDDDLLCFALLRGTSESV